MNPTLLTHLKTLAIGAVIAALAYIGVGLGADPVFHADPIVGAIVGFVITLIGRLAQSLTSAAAKPAPEVVPLSANIDAASAFRDGAGPTPGL